MKMHIISLIVTIFLILGSAGLAHATVSWATGVSEASGWRDVEKTWVGDFNLCWAAAASNMLAWGEWDGGNTLFTQEQIYTDFKNHFTDEAYTTDSAISWWFTGHASYSGWYGYAQLTDTSHQGFYNQEMFSNSYDYFYNKALNYNLDPLSAIQSSLEGGYATSIVIMGGLVSHALNVWGVDLDTKQIWVTDSQDMKNGLDMYQLDGSNHFSYLNYAMVDIFSVEGLLANTKGSTTVPEPAMMLLFGAGLAGLGIMRKRFKG